MTRHVTTHPRPAAGKAAPAWRAMDLHLHTPASSDYQEPQATYLDVLKAAEARGLELIAFTDHNSVAGYHRMQSEIEELELLERLKRLQPEESDRLKEYRRLRDQILVLPGFEFTATFGFHILGIFPPSTPVRALEHLLLSLNIPGDQLDAGSATVGATSDVLTAYQAIHAAGGLAIAAHANSTNGVAMRGFNFGGQTKIAYTQDPHLHALEVTDLEQKGRRTTAAFFNGSKPEYPRRMHCLQGSDAHRLTRDPKNAKNLGIGDRATDVLLDELSFEALQAVFLGNDYARLRPHSATGKAQTEFDYVQEAREQGASIVQDFHESMTAKGGKLYDVLCDICAFANTNGGTLYLGLGRDPKHPPLGISNAEQSMRELRTAIDRQMTPRLTCVVDTQASRGKTIIRVQVPRGDDLPYALDESKIYVRQEAETSLAVRDEIVQLVLRRLAPAPVPVAAEPVTTPASEPAVVLPVPEATPAAEPAPEASSIRDLPRTGVEIVSTEARGGVRYHTMRDLRNNSLIKGVTRSSARKLWHYAIAEREAGLPKPESVTWFGDLGLYKKREKGGVMRYDLACRTPEGMRVFFGVTEDGIHGEWRKVVGLTEAAGLPSAPALHEGGKPPSLAEFFAESASESIPVVEAVVLEPAQPEPPAIAAPAVDAVAVEAAPAEPEPEPAKTKRTRKPRATTTTTKAKAQSKAAVSPAEPEPAAKPEPKAEPKPKKTTRAKATSTPAKPKTTRTRKTTKSAE